MITGRSKKIADLHESTVIAQRYFLKWLHYSFNQRRNSTMVSTSNIESTPKSGRKVYTAPGMRSLEFEEKKVVSFFEFWPTWLIYLPVGVQWLILSIRYGSLTLPLLANPKLPLSGMVGVPKSELLEQATGCCEQAILPWRIHVVNTESPELQAESLMMRLKAEGFTLPLVCKPDIGCRGSGVKLVHSLEQVAAYIQSYPLNTRVMLQKLASWEPEAGIFFVREPGQAEGKIISLALKYSPYVEGDGVHTLKQLIEKDPRASQLQHLYLERHADRLNDVLADGEAYRLVFSASHCRGAVFRDARDIITPKLTDSLNRIMADLPEFYYGRLDIKFSNEQRLSEGEDLEIIEINAASSESLHIWDSRTGFIEAMSALLLQYRTLFRLGAFHRRRGFRTPGVKEFWRRLQSERNLSKYYPETD